MKISILFLSFLVIVFQNCAPHVPVEKKRASAGQITTDPIQVANEVRQWLNDLGTTEMQSQQMGPATSVCGEIVHSQLEYILDYDSSGQTYPDIVRFGNEYFMATGGFAHLATDTMLATTPEGNRVAHIQYPISQEELWIQRGPATGGSELGVFSERKFAFRIKADTPVIRLSGIGAGQATRYDVAYPNAKTFANICPGLQSTCHVQINDASLAVVNGKLFMYFSIFENYRLLSGSEPPAEQFIHSIGLATLEESTWIFRGKILLEHEFDSLGHPVKGAWAPSALVTADGKHVDLFFHTHPGTFQYHARLEGGHKLQYIRRLNRDESGVGSLSAFRVNLDVKRVGSVLHVLYNDDRFNIRRMVFAEAILLSGADQFRSYGEQLVRCDDVSLGCPTPTQVVDSYSNVHLFWNKNEGLRPRLCRALQINSSEGSLTESDRAYLNGINVVYAEALKYLLDVALPQGNRSAALSTIDVVLGVETQCSTIIRVKHACRARYGIHFENLRRIRDALL